VSERRRRVSVRRRPWLALGAGLLGLGAAVAIPLLAVAATHTLSDSTVGEIVTPTPIDNLPDTPAALVAAVDENGQVASLAVFAGAPSGQGGTVIVLPAGAAVSAPGSATKVRLASRYTAGDAGLAELSRSVEQLLGVTLGGTMVVDEAELSALLDEYGPFPTDLPGPVSDSVAGGPPEPVFEAGPRELSAADAARLLTAVPVAESEVVRYPAMETVWRSIAAASSEGAEGDSADGDGADPPAEAQAEDDDAAAGIVRRTLAGPVEVRALSAVPVFDLAANPDELDLLDVDGGEILELVARVLPGAASPVASGLRVKLVDATGRPDAIQDAIPLLSYLGVAIIWIDDGPQEPTTVVGYRNPDDVTLFQELESLFGPAQLVPVERPIEGIDATITLGETFPGFPAEDSPVSVATTVPTSPVTFTLQPDATEAADDGG
jgi:hypothetical protein